jgi:hypothetical protein
MLYGRKGRLENDGGRSAMLRQLRRNDPTQRPAVKQDASGVNNGQGGECVVKPSIITAEIARHWQLPPIDYWTQ